jgi:hypothetical protein
MINKKQIAEMAKKVIQHRHGLQDPQIMHPEREWAIGVAIALCLFLACAGWSIHIYIKNKDVSVEGTGTKTQESFMYRESLVKEALLRFNERGERMQTLLNGASPVRTEPVAPVVASSTEPTVAEENQTTGTTTADSLEESL